MRPVVVFDSNVLISGIGWQGKPADAIELARSGVIEGLTCSQILDEVAAKLHRKAGLALETVDVAINELLTFLRVVRIPGTLRAVPADPADDAVIECAVVGGATHIVTGDRRHLLPMGSYGTVRIITPAELLEVAAHG